MFDFIHIVNDFLDLSICWNVNFIKGKFDLGKIFFKTLLKKNVDIHF